MQGNPRPHLPKPAWPIRCEESCRLRRRLPLLPRLRRTRNKPRPKKSKKPKACTATRVLPYQVIRLSREGFQIQKRDLQRVSRPLSLSVPLPRPSSEPKPRPAIKANPATLMQPISLTSMHHLHLHLHPRPRLHLHLHLHLYNNLPTTTTTSTPLCDCHLVLVQNPAGLRLQLFAERRSPRPLQLGPCPVKVFTGQPSPSHPPSTRAPTKPTTNPAASIIVATWLRRSRLGSPLTAPFASTPKTCPPCQAPTTIRIRPTHSPPLDSVSLPTRLQQTLPPRAPPSTLTRLHCPRRRKTSSSIHRSSSTATKVITIVTTSIHQRAPTP